jgi:hypothetical protein
VDLSVFVEGGTVIADIAFKWDKENELIDSLRNGLESRITLTVRLFKRRPAVLPFLEDIRYVERNISQIAFYDFLNREFIVESENGKKTVFQRPEDLLAGFFSWKGIMLAAMAGLVRPFVTARVQFDPVALRPPLTIVSLFGVTGTYTSPWVRREVIAP